MRPWYLNAIRIDTWLAAALLVLAALPLSHTTAAQTAGSSPFQSGQASFLTVDEAFSFYVSLDSATQISVHWDIAPAYYLYTDKYHFRLSAAGDTDTVTSLQAAIPTGTTHHDEFFGDVEIHTSQAHIVLTLSEPLDQAQSLEIGFQGCAEAGLCYPPQRRLVEIFP